MIKLYFGDELHNEERDIHYLMRAWGQSLEAEYASPGQVDFKCLDKSTDDLLSRMNALRSEMARAMQQGKVGSARDARPATKHSEPNPLCLRK
jgi:hypothetical protein